MSGLAVSLGLRLRAWPSSPAADIMSDEAARSTWSQPQGPFNLKLPSPSTARHEISQSPCVCHSRFLEGSLAPHIPGHCVVCKSRVYFKRKEKRWLASTVESGTGAFHPRRRRHRQRQTGDRSRVAFPAASTETTGIQQRPLDHRDQ